MMSVEKEGDHCVRRHTSDVKGNAEDGHADEHTTPSMRMICEGRGGA